jgi:hypothetical protein
MRGGRRHLEAVAGDALQDPLVLFFHEGLDPGRGGMSAPDLRITDLLPRHNGPAQVDQGQDAWVLLPKILGLDVILDSAVGDAAVEAGNHGPPFSRPQEIADITIAKGVYPGKGYCVSAGGMQAPKVY